MTMLEADAGRDDEPIARGRGLRACDLRVSVESARNIRNVSQAQSST